MSSSDGVERRDRGLAVERLRFNLLANSSLASRATTENVPVPQWLSVSGASNTAPIELTTSIPHGLETGDAVLVEATVTVALVDRAGRVRRLPDDLRGRLVAGATS